MKPRTKKAFLQQLRTHPVLLILVIITTLGLAISVPLFVLTQTRALLLRKKKKTTTKL
jgi:hypothetical protein